MMQKDKNAPRSTMQLCCPVLRSMLFPETTNWTGAALWHCNTTMLCAHVEDPSSTTSPWRCNTMLKTKGQLRPKGWRRNVRVLVAVPLPPSNCRPHARTLIGLSEQHDAPQKFTLSKISHRSQCQVTLKIAHHWKIPLGKYHVGA
ncbi:unnamed protein product [Citrullus colocynthis]|uniref:Uncharacterized protein n=1 Tax=Citrullus colocynthis TaxID=252529 RepID=A0ABP0YKD0_9ROSI